MLFFSLRVEFKDGQYIVSDRVINEYGVGKTLGEAFFDYFTSLVDWKSSLNKYEERPGRVLGNDLLKSRELLNKIDLGLIQPEGGR